jgi:thiol-disulfide isomerase/thioredoxin
MPEEGDVKELTAEDFDKVVGDPDKLVIVEFYTTSCVSCRAIAPVYAKLSKDTELDAVFTKLNAQTNSVIAQRYGIQGTPTFKFFCGGEPIGEIVGAVNPSIIKNQIKDFIRFRKECRKGTTKLTYEISGYG